MKGFEEMIESLLHSFHCLQKPVFAYSFLDVWRIFSLLLVLWNFTVVLCGLSQTGHSGPSAPWKCLEWCYCFLLSIFSAFYFWNIYYFDIESTEGFLLFFTYSPIFHFLIFLAYFLENFLLLNYPLSFSCLLFFVNSESYYFLFSEYFFIQHPMYRMWVHGWNNLFLSEC